MSNLIAIFGDPSQRLPVEQRAKVLADVLNITVPIVILFSLFNIAYEYHALALVQACSLVLIVPAWFMARRRFMVGVSEFLALFSTAFILLYLIYDGGIAGMGVIWGWLFPFIAFYIAGIRRGWYWCLFFLATATIMMMLSLGVTAFYSPDTRVLFFTAYFFYLVVGYWFNALRFQYLFDLEKKVRARTAQIEHASLYDGLTDIPNRLHITNHIKDLIDRKSRNFAVLNLDIDRFNEINNVLGYENGDRLLKAFAGRLKSYMDESMFVARLGADEFALVLQDLPDKDSEREVQEVVTQYVQQLQKTMERPYIIDGAEIELEVTVGIEPSARDVVNAGHMLRRANFASHMAKTLQHKLAIYDSEQDSKSARQFQLFGGLKRAVENHELSLFYQPKVDMQQGKITDVEALIRWAAPENGFVPPDQFIPVAESTGLIYSVTRFVFDESMRQQKLWLKMGYHINIAINISARNLMDPDIIPSITEGLSKHMVSSEDFTLEITESAIMGQPDMALQTIHDLKAMGFSISLDDYGTGYTSLSYLKDMPVDELKIDQSFIFNCLDSDRDSAIVQSTIDLVGNLGLRVVAEGIENNEVWVKLKEMGCDKGQGFFIAEPMPPEEFIQWLQDSDWVHD